MSNVRPHQEIRVVPVAKFIRIFAYSFLVLVLVLVLAGQAWAEEVRISVPGGGALALPVPDGWRSNKQSGPVPTVSLTPAGGGSFKVLVSPLVAPDGRLAPASPDSLLRS